MRLPSSKVFSQETRTVVQIDTISLRCDLNSNAPIIGMYDDIHPEKAPSRESLDPRDVNLKYMDRDGDFHVPGNCPMRLEHGLPTESTLWQRLY